MSPAHLSRLLAAALLAPTLACAQYVGPGPSHASTAAAAGRALDDTQVQLEGQLMQQVRPGVYRFKDSSGTIDVEIDQEDFPAQPVGADTRVRLFGEVDRDWDGVTVDVSRVEIL